jgi:SHS2 domain-containing protein
MASGYRELEGITADAGIEAWGKNVTEAFIGAADGLASLIAKIPDEKLTKTESISLHGENQPDILVKFLNEMIYLEETRNLIPGKTKKLWINGPNLFAVLRCADGSAVDPADRGHVKAATYHGLEINQSESEVRIKVIFDV